MDLSALPNNNHPDKFLQLEVKSLVKNSTLLQARLAKLPEAALPGVQQWHNRIYLQRENKNITELPGLELNGVSQEMIDKTLGKHITPITLKSTIKSNPLYSDFQVEDNWEEKRRTPSWTVQDYDRHSLHSDLASHIKVTCCCTAFKQNGLL
ncbi:major intrinsically disordered NOTCH2-binding receptor 1-like [Meleagris gallopavo]|uniref:major intrinsically disordered NOTCH2-binding receptor 1-like n=1 Tax=Meleagris gallopavo TaxID=9103 RepID=UPI000549DB71|nr:major intrinsically disordered NOTCH2-binding receptor 1-like [Meleagris gallopavo]